MPGSTQQLFWIAQLPLAQAGQLLFVIGISFSIITLIASTYRFHKMIQLSDGELKTVEDCNDFFFVQAARYLSKITRKSSGFGIVTLQFTTGEADRRKVQEALLAGLKNCLREATDKACLFRDDCVAAILDTEPERVPAAAARIIEDIRKIAPQAGASAIRAGVSNFPDNGRSSRDVIGAATAVMETVDFAAPQPFCIAAAAEAAETTDETAEQKGEPAAGGELTRQEKNAHIDPLTGVLRSGVIGSYVRKYLSDLRYRKLPATLFCIAVNRIDQINQLHGDVAADDVIAGVSQVLQRLTRDSDLIGRYGRDNFIILMPCSLKQSALIATRLREAVQKDPIRSQGKPIKTSISIGIAAYPEHGRYLRDLAGGAQRALDVVRGWGTSACLVYDPAQHAKKATHAARR